MNRLLAIAGSLLVSALIISPTASAAAGSTRCTIRGTPGQDRLVGTLRNDVICGLGGNDTLIGNGGADRLLGGTGADVVNGGRGNDVLSGGAGRDTISGGPGKDDASYASTTRPVFVSLNGRVDDGARGERDVLRNDLESITGGNSNDVLLGGPRNDDLNGGPGQDVLRGRAGNDDLDGGPGNDTLDGGPGINPCRTGQGNDVLVTPETCQDVTPPRIRSFSVTPEVSSVTGPQTIIVRLRVTDDLSGFDARFIEPTFRAPTTSQLSTTGPSYLTSGDAFDGTYVTATQIAQFSQLGTWRLNTMLLMDRSGNRAVAGEKPDLSNGGVPIDLGELGYPATFVNRSSITLPPDEREPNDGPEQATLVAPPLAPQLYEPSAPRLILEGTFHTAGDIDWLRVNRTCTGTLGGGSINSMGTPGGLPYLVGSLNGDGTEAYGGGNSVSIGCSSLDAPGTVKSALIRVSGGGSITRYLLTMFARP